MKRYPGPVVRRPRPKAEDGRRRLLAATTGGAAALQLPASRAGQGAAAGAHHGVELIPGAQRVSRGRAASKTMSGADA